MMSGMMSRRRFAGLMGAVAPAAAMAASGIAIAQETSAAEETKAEPVQLSDGSVWYGTPAEIAAKGGSTMPLEELTRRRKEYVDAQTDFVAEDGTVVPAPYVKMRALIHTYGLGCGEGDLNVSMFKRVMDRFTPEQVEAYLQMPWDAKFTANEYFWKCQKEGIERTYEECVELCEAFSAAGFLPFRTTNEGKSYNIPSCTPEGTTTYAYCEEFYADPYSFDWPFNNWDLGGDHALMGTPAYMSIPVNREIVKEGDDLLAYDDLDQMIDDHEFLAIQPCSCRYETFAYQWYDEHGMDSEEKFPTFTDFCTGEYTEYRDYNGDRIETCLAMGDDAEYLVSLGLGRRIDKEEAHEIVQKSRDDGFIFHALYGKEHAWLCMCNPKVCGIVAQWEAGVLALGGRDVLEEKSIGFDHRSHYLLEVDFEKCVHCGTCAGRCPMQAITMDGEDGAPRVTENMCMRCGQCAYVCPMQARKLALRDLDEFIELPHQLEDDSNLKGAYRFEHGLIGRGNTPSIEAYKA